MHAFVMMNSDGISTLTRYPEMMKQLAAIPGIIVDEAFMADAPAFNTFLKVLCDVPYEPAGPRRVPKHLCCPHTGGRCLMTGGDNRQLPPASGKPPFWSTWRFQNLFEIFVLREDRRHERDAEMRNIKEKLAWGGSIPHHGTAATDGWRVDDDIFNFFVQGYLLNFTFTEVVV